jgi:hypothetical protein
VSDFLFFLRTYAEVDHLTPLIWKCLEKGDGALVVPHHSFPYHEDFRIKFLQTFPRFQVLQLRGTRAGSAAIRLASRVIWTPSRARALCERYRVSACFVASRSGVGRYRRRPSRREIEQGCMEASYLPGRKRLARLLDRVLKPLNTSFLLAAKERGIPVFCLPHGVGTELDNAFKRRRFDLMRRAAEGTSPEDWRSEFTMCVFASSHHRQWEIEHGGLDPAAAEAWGSLRFSPQWLEVLDRIVGDADAVRAGNAGRIGVLFLVPKWHASVDRAATEALLLSLAARPDLRLIVKSHPSRDELGPELTRRLREHPNVELAGKANSSTLIRSADVTIVESSSVAIEALVRGKHLIYLSYLRPSPEVYVEYGGCLVARESADVQRFLDLIVRGTPPPVDASARARILSMLVYGGREPFDVPEYYYERIRGYLSESSVTERIRPRISA